MKTTYFHCTNEFRFLEKYFLLRIFDWRFLFSPDINFILRSLSGSYYRNASVRKYSPSLPFFFFLCHNFLFNMFLYLIFLHVKYLEDICHSILLWKLRIYQLYCALFCVCVSIFSHFFTITSFNTNLPKFRFI